MAGVTEISWALHEDGSSRLHPMPIEGWISPRAKRNARGLCKRLRVSQLCPTRNPALPVRNLARTIWRFTR